MSAAYDKASLEAAARFALMDERDRIARQAEGIGDAIRAMRDVREQMQDRLIAILVELQRRDVLGAGKNDGEKRHETDNREIQTTAGGDASGQIGLGQDRGE